MAEGYNPIVREFGRLRAVLAAATGVPRREIRPGTELEALLPRGRRRELWRKLRRQGLPLPWLQLPRWVPGLDAGAVLIITILITLWLRHPAAVFLFVPLALLVLLASRPWATEFPFELRTVGELTLYLTDCAAHRGSGHRWTRDEIAFKVRVVLSDALNIRLSDVRLESRLRTDLRAV